MNEFNGYRVFVDDMRPIPEGWIGSRTVSETISLLATLRPVAEISLDHDILFPAQRVDQYMPLMNETFKGVAYYIARMPEDERPKQIWIHTSNTGAGQTMAAILGLDFMKVYRRYRKEDYEDGAAVHDLRDTPADGGKV